MPRLSPHGRTRHPLLFVVTILALSLPLSAATSAGQKGRGRGADAASGKTAKAKRLNDGSLSEVSMERVDGAPVEGPVPASLTAPQATGQNFVEEVEPNGTTATATPAGGTNVVMRGDISTLGEFDFYSFTANAGDSVYAATQTTFSQSSTDTLLQLIGTDGTTLIEADNDDGSFGGTSSSIAGRTVPTTGTYYLRVSQNAGTAFVWEYQLHLRVQSGSPTAEAEPNDSTATATPLPVSQWVSGAVGAAADLDFYSVALNAGDTVYLGLDLDPERDATTFNGTLAFGLFDGFVIVVNDASVTSPNSEAYMWTVREAGTYFIRVAESAAGGSPTFTYRLSVGVRPSAESCPTVLSTDVPKTIGPAVSTVTSVLTIPATTDVIDSIQVLVDIDMNTGAPNTGILADLDVTLTSPSGSQVALFTDIGSTTAGANVPTSLNLRLDDGAGVVPASTVLDGMIHQPEFSYRLAWFKNVNPGGTWTLTIHDDLTNTSGGTLNAWGLAICYNTPSSCGGTSTTIYSSDFEADDGGFTHSGTADEWERGTPSFAPITTANSGVNAWKTDLDNTYNFTSSQDLLSPNINLAGATGVVTLQWAHKYSMENVAFDHYFVEVRQVGNPASAVRVFEHREPTMNTTVANPSVTIQEAAGWATYQVDISSFIGQTIEVRFHVDSDDTVNLTGVAIDDVSVKSCAPFVGEKDTIGTYTAASAAWFLRNTNTSGGADTVFGYGAAGGNFQAITGDWDNDGDDTPGLYVQSSGTFFLKNTNGPGGADLAFTFGAGGGDFVAISGDWNADGTDTIGLYSPSTGAFFLRNSNTTGMADVMFSFGAGGAGFQPIAGDWNNDNTDTIGLYNQATGSIFLRNTNSNGGADVVFSFGAGGLGFQAIAGDWNNDGTHTVGLYNPSNGAFFLTNSNANGGASIVFSFGAGGGVALAGDWDNLP